MRQPAKGWAGHCLHFWDLDKFYDSIDVSFLANELIRMQWPARQGAIALRVHQAARFLLMQDGSASHTIQPNCSILAGCVFSNSLARVMLHSLLQEAHAAYPIVQLREFVDDVPQSTRGTASEVAINTCQAAIIVARGFQLRKLTHSADKSLLLCSRPALGRKIARILATHGVEVGIRRQANGPWS